jgi:AraC-type DNA-binding domain-containing proteins
MNFIKRMNSVLEYIEDNLDGEISDDRIAILSANSKGMFQRIFTMITDMTLSEYIRKRRLTRATADIQNTDEKIIDIAIKYGYNSPDAFTTAFKSFHGITPSAAKTHNIDLQSFRRITFNPNLTITGGNNNMQYRTISLDETIYFYLRSDFLLYNTLLGGKMNKFWKKAEKVNRESKGMLKEFEEGIRTLDEKQIARYHNRMFEKLDDEAKENIIKVAKIDISNLLGAMKQIKSERLFYRTVWCEDLEIDGLPQPHHYDVNDIVEFKTMSSTAIAPYRETKVGSDVPHSEWINADVGREFYRYEITVPENGFILELDEYDEYSKRWWENGEVILPPIKCKVKDVHDSDNEKCKGIITFEYLERLPDPV